MLGFVRYAIEYKDGHKEWRSITTSKPMIVTLDELAKLTNVHGSCVHKDVYYWYAHPVISFKKELTWPTTHEPDIIGKPRGNYFVLCEFEGPGSLITPEDMVQYRVALSALCAYKEVVPLGLFEADEEFLRLQATMRDIV